MTVLDWADLTEEQVRTIVTSPAPEIDVGCELLNFDLTVAADLSEYLSRDEGDVQWNGLATVHRGCDITLTLPDGAPDVAWGIALVRLFVVQTDTVTGLSARRNIGVFCLTAPDQQIGETPPTYRVTGQDRMYLLDRQVGYSYVVDYDTPVLEAVAQVFVDAGLTGVLIDSSASAATVPDDMVWPLVPVVETPDPDSAPDALPPPADDPRTDSAGTAATWVRIVNDLLKLVTYRGVWADENGSYRCGPYADPGSRTPSFTFDADDTVRSVLAADRTARRDVWAGPNQWVFVRSNMPDDGSGNPTTPAEGAGIYTVTNYTDGPSSVNARNGLVWPTQVTFMAASQDDLVAQGDARVAADKRVVATAVVKTSPFPHAGHFDVFTWNDAGLDEGTWKVEATWWRMPLDGGDVEWSWTRVG